MKDTKLPLEALAYELSNSAVFPMPINENVYNQMGDVLQTIKEDEDYKILFSSSLRDLKKKEKLLYKKMMRLWMFDVLEREYYYRKSIEKDASSYYIKKDIPSYFSAYFHEIMFNLIKDDIKRFQPEKYRERLEAIYISPQQRTAMNNGRYIITESGIGIITKPKKNKK